MLKLDCARCGWSQGNELTASSVIVGEDAEGELYVGEADNKQAGRPEMTPMLLFLLTLGGPFARRVCLLQCFSFSSEGTSGGDPCAH